MLSCMCPGAFIEHSCSQVLSGGRVNFETLVFTVRGIFDVNVKAYFQYHLLSLW